MSMIKLLSTCNITTGKLDANAAVENGMYPFFTCAPEPLRIDDYAFNDNVILLAGNNASGNFHCQRYNGKFNAYQRTYVLTAKNDYDIDYIYYSLLINLQLFKRMAQGSQTKFLTIDILNDFEINDIPIEYQKSIVYSLVKIDKKIGINKSICFELEAMAKLLYDYWFVQFDFPDENGKPYNSSGGKMVWNEELKRDIPDGWEVSTLRKKYRIERGISYSSKDIESGQGMPMINLACIDTKRNYRDGELKYYDGNISNDDILSPFDLLIACTDLTRNADIVGSPILTPNDGKTYTFSTDIAKLIPNETELNPIYLYMALRTEYYHNYIKKWASGTNVLHLDLTGLDWYKMWFPPKSLQDEFAETILQFENKKFKTMIENRELTSLRDFLLPMLMNGQVKVKKEDTNE